MTKIEQAKAFAHKWHDFIGQKRKYAPFPPYWVHTDEVAELIAAHGGSEDQIQAAHGHDLLEDVLPVLEAKFPDMVAVFHAEYVEVFSPAARQMIVELTDVYTKAAYPDLNRKARHAKEYERLAGISVEAKDIKKCDLISNTRSIVAEDKDFAQVYIREKLELLPLISDGNGELLQQITSQTIAACAELGIQIPMFGSR